MPQRLVGRLGIGDLSAVVIRVALSIPVAGIAASVGGLNANIQLLKAMPVDRGEFGKVGKRDGL